MQQNLTLLSIPLMYLTILVPYAYAMRILKRATPSPSTSEKPHRPIYDNTNPHGTAQHHHLRTTLSPPTLAAYERAEAAHRNGIECLPLFAAGILAGNFAGLSRASLGWTAGVYLVLRVLYNGLYIHTTTERGSLVRSAVWAVGQALCVSLFVRAAAVGSG